MNRVSIIQKYVVCPFCRSDVEVMDTQLACKGCNEIFNIIDGDIPSMIGDTTKDSQFSISKWDALYKDDFFQKETEKEYKEYFVGNTLRQIFEYVRETVPNRRTYLEIGCGQGFLGQEFAKRGWFFIGVDLSLGVLLYLKKRLNDKGVKNYLLIQGDIQSLPIRNNSIDLVFGGGVIEHLKNTQVVIDHIFNVLTRNGVSFNTVPALNIGNMIYRSSWGGIPKIPVLKEMAELIHLKILRGRHMVFGYELQFTASQLKKLHVNAGFRHCDVRIERFDCRIQLNMIHNELAKKILRFFCRTNSNFWPAVKVIGIKR